MNRSTLSPDFETSFEKLVQRIYGKPPHDTAGFEKDERPIAFSDICAEHDPRHVAQIEARIRNIIGKPIARLVKTQWPFPRLAARKLARKICKACPDVALPLSCAGSGYIREEALSQCVSINNPFELSLVLRRLNDWVPQVRVAAAACLERNITRNPMGHAADNIVACMDNILDARKFGRSFSEQQRLLRSLINIPNVQVRWKQTILTSQKDSAARALRLALRHGSFLQDLEEFATNANHRTVRRLATRAVLHGKYKWRENRKLKENNIQTKIDLDKLADIAAHDPSIEIARLGIQYIATHPDCLYFNEPYLRAFLTHPNKSISLSAAFGLRKLGLNIAEEMRQTLEYSQVPVLWAARVFANMEGGKDGALIYKAYKSHVIGPHIGWLQLSAELDYQPAIDELNEIALSSPDLTKARRAAKALLQTGHAIPFAALRAAAQSGNFENRNLHKHFSSLRAIEMVAIVANLSRMNVPYSDSSLWKQIQRKRNKCAFLPTDADLAMLNKELSGLTSVSERANLVLGINQEFFVIGSR